MTAARAIGLLALLCCVAAIDPALQTRLQQSDAAAARIKDLTAHFRQEKFTAMLIKPLISTGTVRSAGAVVRWDTDAPSPCSLFADATQLILYYPDQKLEEIYPIDQRIQDLLSSPIPRLKTISAHFSLSPAAAADLPPDVFADLPPGTLLLKLDPTDSQISQHVRQVIVALNPATGLAIKVQTTDTDGDRTLITFSDVHPNTGLDPRQLALTIPAGATVSHPLASAPPADSSHAAP